MNKQVVLSLDSKAYQNPGLINLDSQIFDSKWLKVFTSAIEFRKFVNSCSEPLEI